MLTIHHNNDPTQIFDRHFSLKCHHCQNNTGITAISIPRFEFVNRFKLKNIGIVYKCDTCLEPIFLKFSIKEYAGDQISVLEEYQVIERSIEDFEFEYLPEGVTNDFREALLCYSIDCYNAFAAMCRRTIQSTAANLGAKGTDRVQAQLSDLKKMAEIDEETFKLLKQIVIEGHDGAHPHLPELSPERAEILLELMKDVLYQLYVRKGKMEKAAKLRKKQIEENKK